MPSFLGTKDIGLKTEWRYGFAGNAQRASTTHGVLYIGAGQTVMPGVLDPSADEAQRGCCASLVFSRREFVYNHLLTDWIRRFEEGRISASTRWAPVLITPPDPIFDVVVAAFLAERLIEKGEFPVYAEALVGYAEDVARSRVQLLPNSVEAILAPHLACQAMQYLKGPDGRLPAPEARLARAIEVLDRVLSHTLMARSEAKAGPIRRTADFLPGSPGSAAWAKDPWFADIKALLEAEPARFKRDSESARKVDGALLPADDGGDPIPVNAFIAAHPMESLLHRHWICASGYACSVYPAGNARTSPDAPPDPDPVFPRATVLLEGNFRRDGRRPSLRGLRDALDSLERQCRQARGDSDRGQDDAWSDGAEFNWTTVESPRSATAIPYSKIADLATQGPFGEFSLRGASLTLAWVARTGQNANESRQPLEPLRDLGGVPDAYWRDSAASVPAAPGSGISLPPGFSVCTLSRSFPRATCAPMTIAKIEAAPGETLGGLLKARASLVAGMGGRLPDYVFARVNAADPSSGKQSLATLLGRLGTGPVDPLEDADQSLRRIFFNSRTVIVLEREGNIPEASGDPALELLVYLAFLNESLDAFITRAGSLDNPTGKEDGLAAAAALRRNLLDFRTAYQRSDVGGNAQIRHLYGEIASRLRLEQRYTEARSELDRRESRVLAQRGGGTGGLVQVLLYAVAAMQAAQLLLILIFR